MKRKRISTDDGSHSFYIADWDEHYHSVHGAMQESLHVFIDAGLKQFPASSSISILEIGFGTGLNALLTILEAQKQRQSVQYFGLEAYPLTMKEVRGLNYVDLLGEPEMQAVFLRMHDCIWEIPTPIYCDFTLTKFRQNLLQFDFGKNMYDLVYFDAFAPRVQPELWTTEVFEKLYTSLRSGGILVTYCAKGSVKRSLKTAGFSIESIPGPKGKREMTRAVK